MCDAYPKKVVVRALASVLMPKDAHTPHPIIAILHAWISAKDHALAPPLSGDVVKRIELALKKCVH